MLSAPVVPALAQNAFVSGAGSAAFTQEPAPVERSAPAPMPPQDGYQQDRHPLDRHSTPNRYANRPRITSTQPVHGVTVRTEGTLQIVASDAQHVELKLDHGIANIMVHDPAANQLVLIDLPGGQTQLLKDGFYTFNADTNTVRVFSGEADAFAGNRDKPEHLKGDDQAVFSGGNVKVAFSDRYYSRQDVLPGGSESPNNGYGAPREEGPVYSYAPVPYGYYGYSYGDPYYAYDYPYYGYGWGYPYYGYGIGFGWGGYGYGGYRGSYGYGGYGYGGGVGRGGPIHPGSGGHR